MLGTVKTEKLYLQIADRIIQAIASGEFRMGDRLPQERVLATMLGVSRPTVREALAALEIIGVLEIHPGSGSIVRHVTPQITSWADKVGASPEELIQARMVCEEGVVRQLCRQQDVDLSALEENIRQTLVAHERVDVDGFVEASLTFHPLLAAATNNSVLEHVLRELTSLQDQPLFRLLNKLALMDEANRLQQYQDHVLLLEAIRRRQEKDAASRLCKHLQTLQKFMFDESKHSTADISTE